MEQHVGNNKSFKGNVVIGQSGGPTAVINASVAGVYSAAKSLGVKKVYGMVHGIQGFLEKNLLSLEDYLGDGLGIELLKRTPSAFLGTCRYKLPKVEGHEEVYEKIFAVLEEYEIEAFFYVGGNDSMDTVKMLSDYAAAHGKTQRFVGVPKTIDNDLPITDHCPGYGSAAKYIATSVKEVVRDVQSTALAKPTVIILEIMGRNAGWLTAAAALAKGADCEGADAIYLPEVDFDVDAFVENIQAIRKNKNWVVVALSEGVKLPDGRFVCELGGGSDAVDAFGHKQLSGCAATLGNIVRERTGFKVRPIEFSTLQRAASHISSLTDINEAFQVGRRGMQAAADGETGVMVVMKRIQESPYLCDMDTYDIHAVANVEKTVPAQWITPDGKGLTEEYASYARPLIIGELTPFYVDGLPRHLVRAE
ncbi:MAG: 6-phosphofructokinase [Clostridium sp.]|jgi:6-phosphofructokinase 1|nr:6-phosphofructokinase [Clostridium sp.]